MTAETYEPTSRSPIAVLLSDVYPAYQRQLTQSNAVDFDDLLLHTVDLLRDNEPLRQELDQQYRYVMVDEYQDTNMAQYAIVRALSIDFPNLAVTGDPDQSIYTWRGANISNILGFERDYSDANVVRLEQNFRSTPEILRVADVLIKHNRRRKEKSLIADKASGEPVRLFAFPSQQDEAQYLADEISSLVASGDRRYRDFAIFYRINALSRYLEHTLHQRGIPYQILNGVEFFQRKEVKDVVAYLQLANNEQDDVAFLRIINTPARGLGKVTVSRLAQAARSRRQSMVEAARDCETIPGLSKRAVSSLRRFVAMIDHFRSLAAAPVEEILGHVLMQSGYEEHVRENDQRADEDRCANIRELLTAARQFDQLHQGADYLEAFLEQTSLTADTDAWEDQSDKVTLMTLHATKGLEFPAVYLVAVEQGKLPHDRSREDPDQLEEERRLLFVGLTRAQEMATLSYAKYRDFRGQSAPTVPSEFLMELPRDEMTVITPDAPAPAYPAEWDEFDDLTDFDPTSFDDADRSDELSAAQASPHEAPPTNPTEAVMSSLQTAASLAGEGAPASKPSVERPHPDAFAQGDARAASGIRSRQDCGDERVGRETHRYGQLCDFRREEVHSCQKRAATFKVRQS